MIQSTESPVSSLLCMLSMAQDDQVKTPAMKCLHRHNSVDKALLTLTVLVATIDAQWEGMGDVGLARYEPTLLPPCPTIRVLSCSN